MSDLILSCRRIFDLIFSITHWKDDRNDLAGLRDFILLQFEPLKEIEGGHDITFALSATIDDLMLNSDPKKRDRWIQNTLQGELFSTQNAGEEFYERMKTSLIKKDKRIIEVYYLCLNLGFYGKYRLGKREYRDQIINQAKSLLHEVVELPAENSLPFRLKKTHIIIIFVALQFLFFLVFYFKISLSFHHIVARL